jgi:phage terminase small subunit
MTLTPRQQRFCEEYLADLNATAAAGRAGYSDPNIGRQLITKPNVADAIARLQAERSARVRVTADDVLRELKLLAFSRMVEFVAWGPEGVTLRPSAEIPADAGRCVAEVSETTSQGGGSLRFKLHSKTHALELLGKHLGLFKDVTELTGTVTVQTVAGVNEGEVLGTPGRNGAAHP